MASKKTSKKRGADSDESAQRATNEESGESSGASSSERSSSRSESNRSESGRSESTRRETSGRSSNRGDSGSRPATSRRTGQPLEGKVEAMRTFASRVNWGRVALLTVGVAATVVAVRAVGPRRIVKGIGSLGVAHFAERNASKLSAMASGLFARLWPTITKTASTVVRPPQALLSRLH